jgi:hypothetical protein
MLYLINITWNWVMRIAREKPVAPGTERSNSTDA